MIYIGLMKEVTYVTPGVTIFVFKVHICDAVIAYFDGIANSEIILHRLHSFKVI